MFKIKYVGQVMNLHEYIIYSLNQQVSIQWDLKRRNQRIEIQFPYIIQLIDIQNQKYNILVRIVSTLNRVSQQQFQTIKRFVDISIVRRTDFKKSYNDRHTNMESINFIHYWVMYIGRQMLILIRLIRSGHSFEDATVHETRNLIRDSCAVEIVISLENEKQKKIQKIQYRFQWTITEICDCVGSIIASLYNSFNLRDIHQLKVFPILNNLNKVLYNHH
ncbi:unnamed protein product [Paramecium octaurelia]|uniref:Uncharacterized protein n=1 Tax=Paramecium octaurelia TaxID=43137 RepID=A0A8S1X1I3_PAROT|nr:unnamed protein product [Paramecium octaurelia]